MAKKTNNPLRDYLVVDDGYIDNSALTLVEAEKHAARLIADDSRTVEIYKRVPHTIKVIASITAKVNAEEKKRGSKI